MEIVDSTPPLKKKKQKNSHQYTNKPNALTKGLILLADWMDSFLQYTFSVPNHIFKTDLVKLF